MRRIISENYNKNTFVYTAKGVYIGEGLYRVYASYVICYDDHQTLTEPNESITGH